MSEEHSLDSLASLAGVSQLGNSVEGIRSAR